MKRADVIPGAVMIVKKGHSLELDAHMCLSGHAKEMLSGGQLVVVTKPRKNEHHINLVRVRVNTQDEFECFYCDVLKHCEVV